MHWSDVDEAEFAGHPPAPKVAVTSAPEISKEAFVRRYAEHSGYRIDRLGKTFFEADGFRFTAGRCRCGEDICQGWAMDPGKAIEEQAK